MIINRFFLLLFVTLFFLGCEANNNSQDELNDTNSTLSDSAEGNSQESLSLSNSIPIAIMQELKTKEETALLINLEGSDEDEDNLSFMVLTQPNHGILSGEAPLLSYLPNIDYTGEDSFTFKVNDGVVDSQEVKVTILVEAVNDQPIAEKLRLLLAQDSNKSFTLSAYDVDSHDLNYTIVIPPTHGTLSGLAPELTYTPYPSYVGDDYFAFQVSDGLSTSELTSVNLSIIPNSDVRVKISGKLTYDLVPSTSTHDGLDYANTRQESIKEVVVELRDASNQLLQSTISDANGNYLFTDIESHKEVKIRVYAKMQKSTLPSWYVKVVDNTQNASLYGFEGELISSGTTDSIRNLNARSGWGGSAYSSVRTAAPFAILNVVYKSMQNILNVDGNTAFPPLTVNWSPNNVSASGSLTDGQIGTSHYQNSNLYILGDANSDTDEYDDHVIAHEWGHYYEDKFSRTDSLGGDHGNGDYLDIRVAFGEGFGNAISAISLRDTIYFDTAGYAQGHGWSMDIEQGTGSNAGWFSEISVQHILYDLFDNNNDGNDDLALGFAPLHHVFVGQQKQTPSFTSLFSFIHALKNENSQSSTAIDSVVAKEGIAEIVDNYGTNRAILPSESPYVDLAVGTTLDLCLTNKYGNLGSRNKLSNHKFVKFTLDSETRYHLKVARNNGTGSDPDFTLYNISSAFVFVGRSESPDEDLEEITTTLPAGTYLMDVSDWNTQADACFDVSVEGV